MDFFKAVFTFFTDKTHSISSKFIVVFTIILGLLLVDNILGFSFFYSNGKSIEQLKTIEQLKKDYKDNLKLVTALQEKEDKILNRKNIFESFRVLFSSENLDFKPITTPRFADSLMLNDKDLDLDDEESIPPQIPFSGGGIQTDGAYKVKYRSKIWHTISSSYILIAAMLVLPFIPFTQKPFDWTTFVGMIIFSGFFGLTIILNQYLLGLIPVLFNKPWVNYLLNAIVHFSIFWFLLKQSLKPPQKQKPES